MTILTNFVLTLTDNYFIVNTQFSELSIHSHMNARTMTVYAISNPLNQIQPYTVIWIAMTRTDGLLHEN
jgi:hypothetical protein